MLATLQAPKTSTFRAAVPSRTTFTPAPATRRCPLPFSLPTAPTRPALPPARLPLHVAACPCSVAHLPLPASCLLPPAARRHTPHARVPLPSRPIQPLPAELDLAPHPVLRRTSTPTPPTPKLRGLHANRVLVSLFLPHKRPLRSFPILLTAYSNGTPLAYFSLLTSLTLANRDAPASSAAFTASLRLQLRCQHRPCLDSPPPTMEVHGASSSSGCIPTSSGPVAANLRSPVIHRACPRTRPRYRDRRGPFVVAGGTCSGESGPMAGLERMGSECEGKNDADSGLYRDDHALLIPTQGMRTLTWSDYNSVEALGYLRLYPLVISTPPDGRAL
ncbi:hypothetical protein B0H13DRAFT_2346901 [Mycena leptocephala]|nr:hypothetical protein B0H13DRAFT_2346901 [Mycena leptocephala]